MLKTPVFWLIVVAMAIALIPAMPYGYYPVMRWVVCGACAWTALDAYRKTWEPWAWGWAVLAGIYNPLVSIQSTREIWSLVNVGTIIVATVYFSTVQRTEGRSEERGNQ